MTATCGAAADERQKRERLAVRRAARRHHARHGPDEEVALPRSAPARRSACRGTSCPGTRRRRRSAKPRARTIANSRTRRAFVVPVAAAVPDRHADRDGNRRAQKRRHGRLRGQAAEAGPPHAPTAARRTAQPHGSASARALGGRRPREIGELLADLPELPHELRRRRVALGGVLREAALDRPAQRRRHAGVQALERERLVLDDRRQRLDGRRAVEEPAPRQHLVEDEPGRELVGAEIERAPGRLLGRHVVGRADDEARPASARRRRRRRSTGAPCSGVPAASRDRSPGSSRSRPA